MRFLALLLLLTLAVGSLSACGKKKEEEKKTYKIAGILRIQDMYAAWLGKTLETKAEELNKEAGYEKFKVDLFDFEANEQKWLTTAENISTSGYDFVISQTPPMDGVAAIQAIKDSGAVFVHISTSGYEYMLEQDLCRVIVCNEYGLGRVVAEKAVEELPQNAKVCVILGPLDRQSVKDRYGAIQDVFKEKRPDIEILDAQVANWNKDEAMTKVDDWIQIYDQIDGFLAVNDAMAAGAVESLLSNNFTDWGNMFICGIDGLTDACKYISDGYMTCSANQDATKYADMFFDMIQKHIAGEDDMNKAGFYEFDPILIDSNNAQAQLDYYDSLGLLK